MMSEGKTEAHLKKAKLSFEKYNGMMGMYNDKNAQPYAMYFFLIESLFQRLEHSNLYREFDIFSKRIKIDFVNPKWSLIKIEDKNSFAELITFFRNQDIKIFSILVKYRVCPESFMSKVLLQPKDFVLCFLVIFQ